MKSRTSQDSLLIRLLTRGSFRRQILLHSALLFLVLLIVFIPIMLNVEKDFVELARSPITPEMIEANIHRLTMISGFFLILTIVVSFLAAFFCARRLGRRIDSLIYVANQVHAGRRDIRANTIIDDEVGHLGRSLNGMLDSLLQSEELFRDALDYAPIGMGIIGLDGRFLKVNRSLARMLGYEPEHLLTMTIEELTHPDDLEKDIAQMQRLMDSLIHYYEIEKRYIRSNGSIMEALLTASIVRDSAGRPIQIIKQVQDITERKEAEKSLRDNEEKLRAASLYARTLIEASLDPLVTISNEGKITDVNFAFEKATGLSREALIGTDFAHYFTEPDKAREGYTRVFAENKVMDYPLAIRHTSGAVMDVLYNATVYHDEYGQDQGVFAAARDITARKRAEEALRASEKRLRSASLYARTLIEASLDPLVTISNEGKITDVNLAFEKATGLSREELIGTDFAHYFTEPDKAREGYTRVFAENKVMDYPLAIRHASGSVMDVLYNATVYHDEYGQDQGVFAAARDITARKRLEMELFALNKDLERRVEEEVAKNRDKDHLLIQQSRLAAMGEMVHNIAHQWRQPLNGISILLSTIKDDFDFKELTEESLNQTIHQAQGLLKSMSTTIDDFRNFFRPDREPAAFDIIRAVEDALFIMEASLKNNRIEVVKSMQEGLRVFGYSNQFAQAVLNVLANAKEAIQQQNISNGRIEIWLVRSGNHGVLTIQDNGGGIPADALPRIFEPYFSTKAMGSGIGLYMSRMIIQRNLNGSIEAANEGPGALIRISLPLMIGE